MTIVLNNQQDLFVDKYRNICLWESGKYVDNIFLKKRRSGRTEAILYLLREIFTVHQFNIIYFTHSETFFSRIQQYFSNEIVKIDKNEHCTNLALCNGSSIILPKNEETNIYIYQNQENILIVFDGIDENLINPNLTNCIKLIV